MGRAVNEIDQRNMKTDALAFYPRVPGHLFVRAELRETIDQPVRRYVAGWDTKHSTALSYRLKTWLSHLISGITTVRLNFWAADLTH